jgi:hypothetical protein
VVAGRGVVADPAADGAGIAEELAGVGAAEDGDALGLERVLLVEVAAFEERNAEGAEVAGADVVFFAVEVGRRRARVAKDVEEGVPAAHGDVAHGDGCVLNHGQGFEAVEEERVEGVEVSLLIGEAGAAHVHMDAEDLVAVHAGVGVGDVAQGLGEERGGGDEQQGEADLGGKQSVGPAARGLGLAGCLPMREFSIEAGCGR